MFIISTPPAIVLAGNPVRYNLLTNNEIYTLGTKAHMILRFDGLDGTAGHQFKISFGTTELTFTLATNLSDDPLDVPKAITSPVETWAQWAARMYDALVSNWDLTYNFDITLQDPVPGGQFEPEGSILFYAKNYGDEYTLTFDAMTVIHIVEYTNVDGNDPEYRENFGILMNVLDEDKQEIFGQDFKGVSDTGLAQFNASEYLLAQMAMDDTARFLWPETGETNAIARPAYILPFIAAFAEKYENIVRRFTFDDIRYAMAGGLNRETLVLYNNLNSDYFSNTNNSNRFLTWAPKTKTVAERSVEKLFFLLSEPGEIHFRIVVKLTYTDGTYIEIDAQTPQAYSDYQHVVIECIVGYSYLNLSVYSSTKTVDFWQVWVENEMGNHVSEARKFFLDPSYQENERQLMFRNSFSCYDTVRVTGIRETNTEYERQGANLMLDIAETFFNAPDRVLSVNETVTHKASTGWVTLDEKNWLRDLLLSKEVYQVIGNKLIPVVIDSKKAFISKDKENLYSLEFEYSHAFKDEYYATTYPLADGTTIEITADSDVITADNDIITADQLTY